MKKDLNIQININSVDELGKIIKKINEILEEECNCTCTLNVNITC